MCGIAGIVGARDVTQEDLCRMVEVLRHRGPDDEGYYLADGIGLAHSRLSIIDLAGGRQPIANEDESAWIIFNGEIYNFPELHDELEQRGHKFRTRTDTEVILHLYEEMGRACVTRLRGMFAFAIWDVQAQKLLLARDRFGQKPLYYHHDADRGHFVFGSEIKALLTRDDVPRRLNRTSLHDYLSLRFVPTPNTMFDGIYSVPPAHTLELQDGKLSLERYWTLDYRDKHPQSEATITHDLTELLSETVKCHLISDVPVGAFLSGGLDSSLIVALMSGHMDSPVETFCVGVEEQDYSELPFAKMLAERYQTAHHEMIVRPDIVHLLPEMVWHLDMPGDPIATCIYYASKLAGQHVKVVLGGEGGDELFAGYDRYVGNLIAGWYAWTPRWLRKHVLERLIYAVPDSYTYKSLAQKLRWMHRVSFSSGADRYAASVAYFRFDAESKQELYTESLWRDMAQVDSARAIVAAFTNAQARDLLDRMLQADMDTRMPEHALILADRMSMAQSIESRLPLMDHKVAEYVARIPAGMKLRRRRLKHMQKRVCEPFLPEPLLKRQKVGFMLPFAYWLKNELRGVTRGLLLDSVMVQNGYFSQAYLTQLLEEHESGQHDHYARLWMLLNIELWHRMYIDGQDRHRLIDELAATPAVAVA